MRVLHVLSQRPGQTGSGITLDAMVRAAAAAGHVQRAVVGLPADGAPPRVGGLPSEAVTAVRFTCPDGAGGADLDFPVPGMSDVMPYASSVWSSLTADQIDRYRQVWRERLAWTVADFAPDVIHSHHVWLVSALLKDIAPSVPVVTTCHSTGLRQLALAPNLAAEVRRGCRHIDRFCVLRDDHGDRIRAELGVGADTIRYVGAGYRPGVFHAGGRQESTPPHVLYVGKYSRAKGLPWLLDACANIVDKEPGVVLHVAGDGASPEAEALRARMAALPWVRRHGQLGQEDLAALMRCCRVAVLPSFYEGVPLVLVEAAACGCRLVATALPGVVERLAPALGGRLILVPAPRLANVDQPVSADLPAFIAALRDATARALAAPGAATGGPIPNLEPFTWNAVFARVAAVWQELSANGHSKIR